MTIHIAHLNKAINWHVDLTHIVCYLPSLCYSIINLSTVIINCDYQLYFNQTPQVW